MSTLSLGRAVGGAFLTLMAASASAHPVSIPFDFSRGAIVIGVAVNGVPLRMFLDTGVDPSVIDENRAQALGLKLDRALAGPVSGGGSTKPAVGIPTTITGLAVGGVRAAPIVAGAVDLTGISHAYGGRIDGVLGYNYLKDRIVLIDYPSSRLTIVDRRSEATITTASCRRRWTTPLRLQTGYNTPLVMLHLGDAAAIATLDTGDNGVIELYQSALDLPGVRAALIEAGKTRSTGFNGEASHSQWTLNAPIGLGPFRLPPGASAALGGPESSGAPGANVGNRLLAALRLKLLLDYRDREIGFYGDCR